MLAMPRFGLQHVLAWLLMLGVPLCIHCPSIVHQRVVRSWREWGDPPRDDGVRWGWCGRGLHSCQLHASIHLFGPECLECGGACTYHQCRAGQVQQAGVKSGGVEQRGQQPPLPVEAEMSMRCS